MRTGRVLLFALLTTSSFLAAQQISEQERVAVFRLSYYGQPSVEIESEFRVEIETRRGRFSLSVRGTGVERYDQLFDRAFQRVDERIRGSFVNLGRFEVIGMQQRLTAESVPDFIDLLQDYQADTGEVSEAVLLGQQPFTEADFRRLSGNFVVVVPSVSWFDLDRTDDGEYAAEIETSFTFIDVESGRTFDQFSFTSTGYDEDPEDAVSDAVDGIPSELSFRIRKMERFRLKTGILEVTGSEAIIEFGGNMGLRPGDEYAIIADRALSNGRIVSDETGLLVIRDVQGDVSFATVLYATPSARIGDQLKEVPRRGVETQFYVSVMTDALTELTYLVGLRGIASRGFYSWRPLVNIELPLRGLVAGAFLPINLSLGGEWNLYLGRLKLTPSGTLGVGGAVPLDQDRYEESFYLSHLGVTGRVSGSVLISRDILLHVEAGYGYWVSLISGPLADRGGPLSSYGGLIVGGGITIK